MTTFWTVVLIFCVLLLDQQCYLRAVAKAGRQGTFWQGFCPGSGFYYLLRPHRLRKGGDDA